MQHKRFFHQDVFPGQQRLSGQIKMGFCRRGDDHTLNIFSFHYIRKRQAGFDSGILTSKICQQRFVFIADQFERTEPLKIAH